MKNEPTIPTPATFIRGLRITTKIRLHSGFSADPHAYASLHKVELAGNVFPETNFKKDPNAPNSDERMVKIKSNIHLVRHGAIRLFVDRVDGVDWIRSIDLNPAMLLYQLKRLPMCQADLLRSLSILRRKMSPLLDDPHDARHIVPGLVQEEKFVAQWSKVDSEILLPGIQVLCLHGLSHPNTGPDAGGMKNRIQLGDKQDDCFIRIKDVNKKSINPSIRVRVILKGRELVNAFKEFGTTVNIKKNCYLVRFPESSVALAHQRIMAKLKGTYLPIPTEWENVGKGRKLTTAKVMAYVSTVTSCNCPRTTPTRPWPQAPASGHGVQIPPPTA